MSIGFRVNPYFSDGKVLAVWTDRYSGGSLDPVLCMAAFAARRVGPLASGRGEWRGRVSAPAECLITQVLLSMWREQSFRDIAILRRCRGCRGAKEALRYVSLLIDRSKDSRSSSGVDE